MKEQQSDFEGYRKLIWHGKKKNHCNRRPHVRLGFFEPPPKAQTEEEAPQEKPQKREKKRTFRHH